tara:strand:+ start:1485 stop:2021 length:537 start_codon:yes stop_codon:yes gene_type:complete
MSKIWDYKSNNNDKLAELVKKDNDIVMTNPKMAKDLIDLVSLKKGDIVMECCKGNGAFYNAIPKYCIAEWCEINEGRDYLDFDGNVDYTLSNPPFVPRKLFWSFMEKAMDTTNKGIYWLINFSSLNVFTPKRIKEMNDKGWYIQHFHIVSDKRWYGRYCWLEISKLKNNIISYNKKTY